MPELVDRRLINDTPTATPRWQIDSGYLSRQRHHDLPLGLTEKGCKVVEAIKAPLQSLKTHGGKRSFPGPSFSARPVLSKESLVTWRRTPSGKCARAARGIVTYTKQTSFTDLAISTWPVSWLSCLAYHQRYQCLASPV